MNIEVMTWNIWMGKHLPQVEEFLDATKPDIIGLQEVKGNINGKLGNQAEDLAKKLGYHYAFYPAYTDDESEDIFDQGNAILSKFPIINSESVFLSSPEMYEQTPETEPRIAIIAEIDTPAGIISLINTHLAYSHMFKSSEMRNLQFENLMKLIAQSGNKTILTGDFNSPDGELIAKLSEQLVNADPNPTKPTWSVFPTEFNGFKVEGLQYRLDHIFTSQNILASNPRIPYTEASDHLPVHTSVRI